MRDFRELKVWEKAHQVSLEVYRATSGLPKEEQFGLTSQIRRGAVSIASNIAEGCGRDGDPEFARSLRIAMGSASETEYQLLLAKDLGYISEDVHQALESQVVEVKKMLTSLIKKLTADR